MFLAFLLIKNFLSVNIDGIESSSSDSLLAVFCFFVPNFELLLESFIEEQVAIGKTYNDYKDVSSHFYYWIAKKKTNTPEKGKSSQILGLTN
jgi:hypothetical protein